MAEVNRAVAVSHVGKIRSNNQDSGYAGTELFVVADGMGGHAGGDVASAIALQRIREADRVYASAEEAEFSLQAALIAANAQLAETVFEHPELTGMGTTVSAIARVGDQVALAHIGDSRIYLFREGVLKQVSTDHTFVQRLVDSGRITEEEAMVHPRRSVLMRVLGDVDSHPEIDTWSLDTKPGDRWLICSDGLTGVVKDPALSSALAVPDSPRIVAERLVHMTLEGGAPDNVTVVILDIADDEPGATPSAPVTVGSAAAPLAFEQELGRSRALRLPSLRLHPRPAAGPTHFEPDSEDYLDELIEEDARRARRRKLTWLVGSILVVLLLALGAFLGYQWTQSHYYVGVQDGRVTIYQGVQQGIGPISLSHVYDETSTTVDQLSNYDRQQVQQTINAESLAEAQRIVKQLTDAGTQ
ncbi:PP2C family protein-serine/threonine phosphatase [Leifsonia sp. Root112D2]|uniref:PP2C family protein-serine/threonine phosphatase n=1 Tax=Leifsonia sp. Root112D2 TaxID=1736426 RepID=UPI0007021806|nr:PP2C family serine/threonine-protein phosphatase [Leifsonia sp. Root112D2]KQV06702.1 protein phosphatase [Leifsonia sp. Root112D2]